jgi:hypothetical protein
VAETRLTRDGIPIETRDAHFRAASYNADNRTIKVSLGTGAPVQRYDWMTGTRYVEVLSLEPGHVRLGRLNGGAPFLESHQSYNVKAVVGRFVEDSAAVEDGELVGTVRLSQADRNRDTVRDIIDGILANTSVGYAVHRWDVAKDASGVETRTAIDWEPYEGSIVPIPADPTGGVRSADDGIPPAPVVEAGTRATTEVQVMDEQQVKAATEAAREEGARAEAERRKGIEALAAKFKDLDAEKVRALVDDPATDVATAGKRLLDLVAERDAKGPRIEVTRDEGDTFIRAAEEAIEVKCGVRREFTDLGKSCRGMTLVDLARGFLRLKGINARGMVPHEVASLAMRAVAGHTTSDFPLLFANVGNKKLRAAYGIAPEYGWWKDLGQRVDFADFKTRYINKMNGLGVLATVAEGAEYQGVTQTEARESVTPVKKGGEFRLTLEMVTNDDLNAFARQAQEFGFACSVTEAAMVLALFTTPQTMGDSIALFHSSHANLSTSGGVPDLTKIGELDGFLRNATDGNSHVIGRAAKIGLFPVSVLTTVEQLYSDRYSPTVATNAPTVPLERENRRYVPGLTTKWFLCTGNPLSLEYGWLQGEGGPVVTTYEMERADSLIFHCRDVFNAVVVDYQSFASNPGA